MFSGTVNQTQRPFVLSESEGCILKSSLNLNYKRTKPKVTLAFLYQSSYLKKKTETGKFPDPPKRLTGQGDLDA